MTQPRSPLNPSMIVFLIGMPALAGCLGPAPVQDLPLGASFLDEAVVEPLRIEGNCTNGVAATAPAPVGPVHSTGGVFSRTARINGTVLWIDVNLTWTAVTELNREYALTVGAVPRNGTLAFAAQGPSPLRVRAENVTWAHQVNALRVEVRPVARSALGASWVVAPTQPFLLEGSVGLLVRTSLAAPNQTSPT